MSKLQQTILAKKAALVETVSEPLYGIARKCEAHWADPDRLDAVLTAEIASITNCSALYVWALESSRILSSLVQPGGADVGWRGRSLADRPYLKNNLPFKGTMLSSVYQSMHTHKQCITVLQAIRRDNDLLGFLAADFALSDLLADAELTPPDLEWHQYRGDPAVRGTLFMQQRAQSPMDDQIDLALDNFARLIEEHGVFHVKIHFSSGRCTLWMLDDPYSYRMHGVEEVTDPDIDLAYPLHTYPPQAKVSPAQVREVLQEFRDLRFADETIYLRIGSLNIMNGMVGLTFSCDGSHYMQVSEFLEKKLAFWIGELAADQEDGGPSRSVATA